jgi:hypothetical protein
MKILFTTPNGGGKNIQLFLLVISLDSSHKDIYLFYYYELAYLAIANGLLPVLRVDLPFAKDLLF